MARNRDLAAARIYLWRLIRFRQRSEREIRERLTRKEYPPQVIDEAVAYLRGIGYLNDYEFAKAWIESRLRKPFGLRVIRLELERKGIEEEIIEGLLQETKQTWDEGAVVERLAGKYFSTLKKKKEFPQRIKPKLYSYLIRRGFSPDIVSEAISRIIKDTNEP